MNNITHHPDRARAYPVAQSPEQNRAEAAAILNRASEALLAGDLDHAYELHKSAGRKIFVLWRESKNILVGSALLHRNAREKMTSQVN